MNEPLTFEGWQCPLPLSDPSKITLAHGGGGKLSSELIEHLFLPTFQNKILHSLRDSSLLELPGCRLAFSTDSFVVRPLFFPAEALRSWQ